MTGRNQKQTLSQNYRRLGLTSKLNRVAGGVEKSASLHSKPQSKDPLAIASKLTTSLEPGVARIERDPDTGAILRVIDDGGSKAKRANPLNDPLNHLDDDSDMEVDHDHTQEKEDERTGFDSQHLTEGVVGSAPAPTAVVAQLEERARAARGGQKVLRKQSGNEREWIRALVQKYGEDYKAMSRDRKLNVMQQSEGDIRRRVRRWKVSMAI